MLDARWCGGLEYSGGCAAATRGGDLRFLAVGKWQAPVWANPAAAVEFPLGSYRAYHLIAQSGEFGFVRGRLVTSGLCFASYIHIRGA